ncbi:NAC domain-containing protein 96 [Linum perenne]
MAEQDSSQTLDLPLQKLPPGYRFNPTDEELVSFYLYKHISGLPLQNHSFCPVFFCNLYSFKEPWEIWSECQSQKFGLPIGDVYLITKLKKKKNGSRIDRYVGTSGGSWHRVDKDFTIKLNCSNSQEDIVGIRKKFSYRNLGSAENKCWILSEYSISFDGGRTYSEDVICKLKNNHKSRLDDSEGAQPSTKRKFGEVDHNDATGDGEADGDDFYIDEILAHLEDKAEPECNAQLEEVQSPMRQISQVPLDPSVASDFCLENDDPFSDLQDLPLPDFYKF